MIEFELSESSLYENMSSDSVHAQICPPIYDFFLIILDKYYIPFIVFVGLVGNLLSCIVFLSTHLKMRSSSYYLAALGTADFGFLTVLLLVYLSGHTGLEFFNKPIWCQCLVYMSSVFCFLSVWLIVAFTVERFIAVQYPLQRPYLCTVSRAKMIVLILTIVALVSQSYSLVTAGVVQGFNGSGVCDLREEYHDTMRVINVVDTIVTLISPFILIVVMNTMIARNLLMFRRRFQHGSIEECLYSKESSEFQGTQTQSAGSTNGRNGSHRSCSKQTSLSVRTYTTKTNITGLESLPGCVEIKSSGKNIVSTKNQITKMLLLISSVFILLNLPSYMIRLYVFFFFEIWKQDPPRLLWCLQQFGMMLYYTNFSINFLLYAVCGETFRKCLIQLMRNKLANLRCIRRACTGPTSRSTSNGAGPQAMRLK